MTLIIFCDHQYIMLVMPWRSCVLSAEVAFMNNNELTATSPVQTERRKYLDAANT